MACDTATAVAYETSAESNFTIRDLRQHSPETIQTLRALLAGGGCVKADPKRPCFYELSGDTHVFYIYVSPVDGTIELLATWAKYELPEPLRHAHTAA